MTGLTREQKQELYVEARKQTGLTIHEWSRLFTLDSIEGSREVTKKENPIGSKNSRGVSLSDALAAQLLSFMKDEGFEINKFTFNENGKLIKTPKHSIQAE